MPNLKEKEVERENEKEKKEEKEEVKADKKEKSSAIKPESDSIPPTERQEDNEVDKKSSTEGDAERAISTGPAKPDEGESKTEGPELEEKKSDDDIPTTHQTPTPTPALPLAQQPQEPKPCASFESDHSNTYGTSTGSREEPPQRFGIIKGEGSVWVEWLINSSRGGSVSVGAMTAAAAEDPDAR